jgi:hypothetical protein
VECSRWARDGRLAMVKVAAGPRDGLSRTCMDRPDFVVRDEAVGKVWSPDPMQEQVQPQPRPWAPFPSTRPKHALALTIFILTVDKN